MTRLSRLLLACALCLGLTGPAQATIHIVDCVSGPLFTIQSAVTSAVAGDTIVVKPCIYNESVTIVNFDRLSLIAADAGTPLVGAFATGVGAVNLSPVVIDSSGTGGPCVRVTGGNNVTISGFRMANCDTYGIISDGFGTAHAFHGNLIYNVALNGINDAGGNTRITSNVVGLNGDVGIFLEISRESYVADNRSLLNVNSGIFVFGDLNHVVNNQASNNGGAGITVNGNANRIERNTANGNSGVANVLIDIGSTNADVAGNNTAGSITDLGVATELADNT